MDNEKISVRQIGVLVILAVIGDSILVSPALIAQSAKQDAWISGLFGVFVGMLIAGLIYYVSRLFPNFTLMEFNRKILGKWAGGVVSLLFLCYFLMNTAAMSREISDFITTQMMPETPIWAIHLILVLLLLWGIRGGIETIARSAEMLFPCFFLFLICLLLFLTPQIKLEQIFPILPHGFKPILKGSIYTIAYPYADLIVFLMVLPSVIRKKHANRDYALAAFIGGIVLVAVILICTLVLGSYITAHQRYPTYALAKKISIGNFLERVEAFLTFIWIMSIFIKTILYGFAFVKGMSQLFNTKDEKFLLLPSGFIIFGLAYAISPDIVYYQNVLIKYWPFWDLTYALLFPLLCIIVYHVRIRFR
ncbi:GerAB/ArcD/ProY family transporter [Cohnella mopanensis]|uniref:GerAB/ArcD/ProY family transporter n=1 Tax=Cohnella mopanensis TaxID=2911966 RepID=UPI001EF77891|nr:endospore germination permease [Cohnella mopanensis]